MKRTLQVGLGFALTALFIWLAVRNVDWSEIGTSLTLADYRYVAPAALITLTGYGLRALRWQQLLRPIRALPLAPVAAILLLGFAANNILPARVGELVRAHELGRTLQVSRVAAFTTILLERVFDGLTLLLLLLLGLIFSPAIRGNAAFQATGYFSALVFLGAAGFLGLALWRETVIVTLTARLLAPLPETLQMRLKGLLDRLLEGLIVLKSGHLIGRAAAISAGVWICEGTSYYLILRAFHLPLALPAYLLAAGLVVALVNLGIMVPSAPGYIGTFQFFAGLALAVFGISAATALSIALVAHGMQYVMITVIGLLIFVRRQSRQVWSIAALKRDSR